MKIFSLLGETHICTTLQIFDRAVFVKIKTGLETLIEIFISVYEKCRSNPISGFVVDLM